MKVIAIAEHEYGPNYLVTADDGAVAPFDAGTVVQVAGPGGAVSAPVSIGSLTAHDPYTDWQPIEDPPPLAEILDGVVTWPDDLDYTPLGRPFLTREVGERIIAEAAGV